MKARPEEISAIIKEQIQHYEARFEMREIGTVMLVGDGIASIYGLRDCMAGELLEFEDGSVGLARTWRRRRSPPRCSPRAAASTRAATSSAPAAC